MFSDADPGSIVVETDCEVAGSPALRNRVSWDPEFHPETPVPGLSEPILPGIMHTDGAFQSLTNDEEAPLERLSDHSHTHVSYCPCEDLLVM